MAPQQAFSLIPSFFCPCCHSNVADVLGEPCVAKALSCKEADQMICLFWAAKFCQTSCHTRKAVFASIFSQVWNLSCFAVTSPTKARHSILDLPDTTVHNVTIGTSKCGIVRLLLSLVSYAFASNIPSTICIYVPGLHCSCDLKSPLQLYDQSNLLVVVLALQIEQEVIDFGGKQIWRACMCSQCTALTVRQEKWQTYVLWPEASSKDLDQQHYTWYWQDYNPSSTALRNQFVTSSKIWPIEVLERAHKFPAPLFCSERLCICWTLPLWLPELLSPSSKTWTNQIAKIAPIKSFEAQLFRTLSWSPCSHSW